MYLIKPTIVKRRRDGGCRVSNTGEGKKGREARYPVAPRRNVNPNSVWEFVCARDKFRNFEHARHWAPAANVMIPFLSDCLLQIQVYGFNAELYHNMSEAQHKSQGLVAISLMVQVSRFLIATAASFVRFSNFVPPISRKSSGRKRATNFAAVADKEEIKSHGIPGIPFCSDQSCAPGPRI